MFKTIAEIESKILYALLTFQAPAVPIITSGMNAAKHQNATFWAASTLLVSENPE